NQDLDQKIAGIGARLGFDKATRSLIIESPLPGSPALRAGLRPGDTIADINGVLASDLTAGKELETAVSLIKGPPGSPVTLGIRRLGDAKVESIRVVRDTVRLPTVFGIGYKGDQSAEYQLDPARRIGYIRLGGIARQSPD